MEVLFLVLLAVAVVTADEPPLVDLTQANIISDPPSPRNIEIVEKGSNRIYIGVEVNQMCGAENTGTHLEAPITFNEHSGSVQFIPHKRVWRVPGVVMDISEKVHQYYNITAEVLQAWTASSGLSIPNGGILLIHTGYKDDAVDDTPKAQPPEVIQSSADGSESSVPDGGIPLVQPSEGTSSKDDAGDDPPPPAQPRLTEDAGAWLANYGSRHGLTKGICGVGIDLNSLDGNDQNTTTSARARLYEKGIYALHNLKNIDLLPKSGFLVTVMQVKIKGGSRAPARVWAEREDTRPKHDHDDDDEDDDSSGSDWNSESDHKYPYPRWGHGGYPEAMSAGERSCSCNIGPVMVILPLLMFLRE